MSDTQERPVSQLVTACRTTAAVIRDTLLESSESGEEYHAFKVMIGLMLQAASALQASEERERELKAELWKAQHPNIEINGGKP